MMLSGKVRSSRVKALDLTAKLWRRSLFISSDGTSFQVDNPFTGKEYAIVPLVKLQQVEQQKRDVNNAQKEWIQTQLHERIQVCEKMLEYFEQNADSVAADISGQMGKPVHHAHGEIRGLSERTKALIDMAPDALATVELGETTNQSDTDRFYRAITHEPVGVVLTLAPWNYPLLTAVNSIVAAVLAGNGVIVNHGYRAPLVADHFEKAFAYAGAPKKLVSALHCEYDVLHKGIRGGLFDFVSFTGSVPGGKLVYDSVAEAQNIIDCTLELGGNDGAYVAEDADLNGTVETIVDAALFNAGQSCCGMERAFVHESIYDEFLDCAEAEFERAYGVLGDPSSPHTNMGPMAQPSAISNLAEMVSDASNKGAKVITGGTTKQVRKGEARFFQPTLLANCDSSMQLMHEESFGPILAVSKVQNQEEAVKGINASRYGLTSAIFTADESKAKDFASGVQVGTVFMNRADYLDPYLPWQGRKDTGKGLSLSKYSFNAFTRPKNLHFKRYF